MLRRFNLSVILLLLLSACARGPTYDRADTDGALTPRDVAAAPQRAAGMQVLWGGIIMSTINLKDRTQIEVLAYPLDTDSRPQVEHIPLGRFIFEQAGYLEPVSYARQRQITVNGTVAGTLPGRVGESGYNFPLVTARQHTLWPEPQEKVRPNVHFGIGVGSGGHWGGGVGVGF